MTHTSLAKMAGSIAVTMLLAASSVAFAQTGAADPNYTDNATVQSAAADNTSGTGGSGDATTPGVPNTGAGMDSLTMLLLVLGAVVVASGAYFLMRPDTTTQV